MRKVIVVAVAFLIAAGLALGWYLTRVPTGPLPSTDPAAVAAMQLQDATRPGWPKCVVAPADYAPLLRLFEGGVRDPTLAIGPPAVVREGVFVGGGIRTPPPTTWVPLARVVISYRGGQVRVVTLFRTDEGPGAYQVFGPEDHGYYRASSGEEIAATLAACLQHAADRPAE